MSATKKIENIETTVGISNEETASTNTAEVTQFPIAADVDLANTLKAEAESKSGKSIKDLAENRSDMFRLNPYLIRVIEGFNCRNFNDPANKDHVMELARSIKAMGVREPITVFTKKGEDGVFLADGECRLRATIIAIEELGADIRNIPAKLEHRFNVSEADRIFAQWQRNGSKNFTVMEMANAFVRCLDGGYTEEQLVEKSGMGLPRIKQILAFKEEASPEIQKMVSEGKVSVNLAQTVMKESDSVEKAGIVLKRAVKTAEKAGKSKATAKHLGGDVGKKLNLKKTLADLFEGAKTHRRGDTQVVTFSSDDYNQITDLLGIGIAG